MVNFVQRLRDTPQLRVLRLVRQASSYVHISLALWEPLDLKGMLEKIPFIGIGHRKENRLFIRRNRQNMRPPCCIRNGELGFSQCPGFSALRKDIQMSAI